MEGEELCAAQQRGVDEEDDVVVVLVNSVPPAWPQPVRMWKRGEKNKGVARPGKEERKREASRATWRLRRPSNANEGRKDESLE